MIRKITILLLLAISSGLYAQRPNVIPNRPYAQKRDTLKRPKVLKEWTLSQDYSEEVSVPIDTAFSLTHRFKIADKYSPVNANLGNYGLPFYQLDFFDRITDPDKFLYYYYYPLMHTPYNTVFTNTTSPFTQLNWSFAGPVNTAEQTFRIKHTQNINRFLNFGLVYDIVYSLGQYNYQRSEDKTFTFYTSYTGPKYKLYLSTGINNLTSYENGGIKNLEDLNTTNTLEVPTYLGSLDKAQNILKNRYLLLVQRYTIGNTGRSDKSDTTKHKKTGFLGLNGTFSHVLLIERTGRNYIDDNAKSGYYNSIYIDTVRTKDTLSIRSIKNTIRFDFSTDGSRKFRLGGGVGLRNELFRYTQLVPTHILPLVDSTSSRNDIWKKSNNVLVGKLFNNIGEKFSWIANGELYLTGYRIGDFILNGEILKSFDLKKGRVTWLITGSMMNRQPSFWYQQWGSNNFEWHNNLNKEFRVDVGTALRYPGRKTEIKFNYAIITNYTDFDTTAMPSQYSGGLSVAAVNLKNEMHAWKFHLASDITIQKSSNSNILDLPLATLREAAFFEHLFRFKSTGGKLYFQLGADVNYNTKYYPYAYMPATGRFYRQQKVTAGEYPYIDAFVNLKIKRTRIFVMYDHINSGLMQQSMRYNYYSVPYYPINIRMLRYGLSWTFYD